MYSLSSVSTFLYFFFNLFTEDSKALELAGAGSDELQETEDVKLAREELKVLHDEKHRTEKLRATVMKELEQARVKTRQIEEVHYLCFCILFVLWLCSFKNLISSCFERAIYWYKHYGGKIWILLGPIFVFNFSQVHGDQILLIYSYDVWIDTMFHNFFEDVNLWIRGIHENHENWDSNLIVTFNNSVFIMTDDGDFVLKVDNNFFAIFAPLAFAPTPTPTPPKK